jgi:hypothetical protein
MSVRLLVVARHPVRLDDFGLDDGADIEVARLARRIGSLADLVAHEEPDVVLVDVTYPDGLYADLVLMAIVGPLVTVSIIAVILGLNDSLPRFLLTDPAHRPGCSPLPIRGALRRVP